MPKSPKEYPVSAEQYLIKRYEDSQQEIEELKKEIDSLSDELNDTHQMYMNTPVPDPESVVRLLPALETYYKASTSSYIIDKESYASYKKALAERNIYVLTAVSNTSYSKYLYIYTVQINAIIRICDVDFKCSVKFSGDGSHKLEHHQIDSEYHKSVEDVQNWGFLQLEKDLKSFEKKNPDVIEIKEETPRTDLDTLDTL